MRETLHRRFLGAGNSDRLGLPGRKHRPGQGNYRPANEDHLVSAHFTTLRRYTPAFLAALDLQAATAAQDLLAAINVIRTLNTAGARKIPDDAPIPFIRSRWKPLDFTATGTDRGFYEFCALAEPKNALRSADMWVAGSRPFRDFDDYLLACTGYTVMKDARNLLLVTATGSEQFLQDRLALLSERLHQVNGLASRDELPGVLITANGVKITPLETTGPAHAQPLIVQASAMFPRIRITDLLMEVDGWTGFTHHFTSLKSSQPSKDKQLLLTAILADGINLGLTKMSESCTGVTYAQLDRHQASHIRDETFSAAWRNWSIPSTCTPSPRTGATAPPRPRTGSASVPAARPNPPGM